MEFGYFFMGINQSEAGSHGKVQIRPLMAGFPTEAPARIDITVPLDTTHAEQTLSEVAAHCLQSVRELLPETALQAWSAKWRQQALVRPTIPEDAEHRWANL